VHIGEIETSIDVCLFMNNKGGLILWIRKIT